MSSRAARAGLGRWHVERSRLVTRASGPRTVIEAAAGYGKTSLAREVAATDDSVLVEVQFTAADGAALPAARRVAGAVRMSGLDTASRLGDLATDDPKELLETAVGAITASTTGPVLLLLDDAHHLGEDAARLVSTAVSTLDAPHRLIVCARRIPSALLEALPDDGRINTDDLTLRPDETAEVLRRGWDVELDVRTRDTLVAACGGWPGAVVLAAPRLAAADALDAPTAATRAGAIANLVADLLGDLDDTDIHALTQLARLPYAGPALDRALGRPDLFERCRAAGLPFHATGLARWWTLPDVVREQLVSYGPADADLLARAAAEYVRRDLTEAAVVALLDAGATSAAADLLAELTPGRVEGIDIADLQTMVDRVAQRELARRPGILVHLARASIPAVAIARRSDALIAAAASDPPARVRREIDAELALDLVRDGHVDEAMVVAHQLLHECGADETLTRARAFDILGRAIAWKGETESSLRTAGEHLRTAAALADAAGVPGVASEVLLALAYMVEFPLGRLGPALEAMDAALARVPARPRRRATIQTFRAEILHALGRDSDASAALAEAAELARRLGDDRLTAYAAWEGAKGASRRGEHDLTLALLEEVQLHRGAWFDHPTGMVFLADAAECCERISEPARSITFLTRAEQRMRELLGNDDLSVWMARAACAARSGDPDEALAALELVDRLPGLSPKDRWRPLALRAHALARRGDTAAAIPLARAALDLAAANGTAGLPDVLEPLVAAALRDLVAASVADHGPTLHVQMLGRFAVQRGGEPLTVPSGLPEQLVKLLALSGGRLHQDVVMDRLWPDSDMAGASQRLRNVLHRVRQADIVRRSGDTLALATPLRVDVAEFDTLATRAAATGGVGAAPLARRALALYTGPLLPDDLYTEWTIAPRERARRTFTDLLEHLADDAIHNGEPDVAVQYLERALAADPDSEHRSVRLARLHADAGRSADALRVLDDAEAVLIDLGVQPSADHLRLRADLRG